MASLIGVNNVVGSMTGSSLNNAIQNSVDGTNTGTPSTQNQPASNILSYSNWNNQLRECSIQALEGQFQSNGILSFPVSECTVNFSQDIVQHKKPNVPGAKIESMGANPIVFKIRAPFLFGLQRGSGETWADLFPQTFVLVFEILNDDTAPNIDFVHPILGNFTVKPQGGNTITTTDVKNGQILEFELIQSDILSQVSATNDYQAAQSAATLYDTTKFTLTPELPTAITSINVSQLLGQINGLINSTTLEINQLSSSVNHAINQVQRIQNSLNALKQASTSGLVVQLETVKSGMNSLKNGFQQPTSTIGVYVLSVQMTLAAVAATVHNTVAQIIQLNPGLSKIPNLQEGTQIVYYK